MPIINQTLWQEFLDEAERDSVYAGMCVDFAKELMKLLDENHDKPVSVGWKPYQALWYIKQVEKKLNSRGLTMAMEGYVVYIVRECHSRGQEFAKAWLETLRR